MSYTSTYKSLTSAFLTRLLREIELLKNLAKLALIGEKQKNKITLFWKFEFQVLNRRIFFENF